MSLEDKLKIERRTCANCKLVVENPFLEKCPRCYSDLTKIKTDCNECLYGSKCSFKRLYK